MFWAEKGYCRRPRTTFTRFYTMLSLCLFKYGTLHRNVASLVKPLKVPKAKMKVWTNEELVQFLHYVKPYRYYMIILLAAACGLRQGEAIALR